jgi:hypothetical protein
LLRSIYTAIGLRGLSALRLPVTDHTVGPAACTRAFRLWFCLTP